ncbi:restriction endonuclease subunit S [Dolichospermum sp. UHCC 0259]|uniref:restriction endonuclease subunit S n=1 Tax=Dolichospermum sp. UHCC 0259 TaxID=2590010 RepID=UPI0014466F13|nr:restriction endonuclease subunit S [Dolichospermum sp. UHCC 0259]MTJ50863.1 hypothetical protein [Dolichospermum sp. UHCC 0259]
MKNWELVRLGDICNLINGRAYKKAELLHEGKYPVLRVGNFFSNRSWYYSNLELDDSKYCDDGDLLYAWSASFGPRIWKGGKVIYHYHIWKTNLNLDKVDKKYLYYWFEWDTERIKTEQGVGTTMIHVTKEAMENRSLYLPAIPEQKRIVAIADEAFEGIDTAISNTEKNLSNARELFESYLNSIFSQKGEGWEEKKLGNLLDTLTDYHANGSYEILKRNVRLLDNDGYAYMVRSTDFENKFTNSLKYIDKHAYEFLSKSKVFGGEIIISKIGNAGKVYLMPTIDRPCSLAMNLFLLRTNLNQIQSDYLYFFLESRFGKVQIYERLNGTTTKTIRKDGIRSLNILVPPLSEQKNIVEKLDTLLTETQRLENIYRQKIAALKELKQSILQKAFTGELTTDKGEK